MFQLPLEILTHIYELLTEQEYDNALNINKEARNRLFKLRLNIIPPEFIMSNGYCQQFKRRTNESLKLIQTYKVVGDVYVDFNFVNTKYGYSRSAALVELVPCQDKIPLIMPKYYDLEYEGNWSSCTYMSFSGSGAIIYMYMLRRLSDYSRKVMCYYNMNNEIKRVIHTDDHKDIVYEIDIRTRKVRDMEKNIYLVFAS